MSPNASDRLAARERPEGTPVMYQSWGSLLFTHWEMSVGALRRLLPARLSVDTFDGRAWVSVTPFTLRGVRPVYTPPVPWLS